jgi:hypothetical protein
VLLVFVDSDGCRVTVRVARAALDALFARLGSAPDPDED